jgi:ribosomal protein L24E
MTAYSSTDVQSIAISPGQGGCGQEHRRDGARVFRLECEKCAAVVLGHDGPKTCRWTKERGYQYHQPNPWPGWASAVQDIPLTFDEQLDRDRMKQTGQTQLERLQAMAMAAQLGIPVPQALASALGGVRALEELKEAPQVICADGHSNRAGARFCDLCGCSMQAPAAAESSVA